MLAQGTLTVIPLKASIEPNLTSRMFESYMNPLIKFSLEDQTRETKVCSRGGVNPQWNQVIALRRSVSHTLFVELIDHRTIGSDQMIGKAKLDISGAILSQKPATHQLSVKKDHKVTGKIHLTLFFEGDSPTQEDQFLLIPETFAQLDVQKPHETPGSQNKQEYQSVEEDKVERLITIRSTWIIDRELIDKDIVIGGPYKRSCQEEEKVGRLNPLFSAEPHPLLTPFGWENQDPFFQGGVNVSGSIHASGSSISCEEIRMITSNQTLNKSFTRVSDVMRIDHLFESDKAKPIFVLVKEQIEDHRIFTSKEMDRILDSGDKIQPHPQGC